MGCALYWRACEAPQADDHERIHQSRKNPKPSPSGQHDRRAGSEVGRRHHQGTGRAERRLPQLILPGHRGRMVAGNRPPGSVPVLGVGIAGVDHVPGLREGKGIAAGVDGRFAAELYVAKVDPARRPVVHKKIRSSPLSPPASVGAYSRPWAAVWNVRRNWPPPCADHASAAIDSSDRTALRSPPLNSPCNSRCAPNPVWQRAADGRRNRKLPWPLRAGRLISQKHSRIC